MYVVHVMYFAAARLGDAGLLSLHGTHTAAVALRVSWKLVVDARWAETSKSGHKVVR